MAETLTERGLERMIARIDLVRAEMADALARRDDDGRIPAGFRLRESWQRQLQEIVDRLEAWGD